MSAYGAGPDLSAVKVCTVNGVQSVLCTVTITNIGNVASVAPMSLTDLVTGSSNINLTGAGGTLPASCTPGAQLINNVPINCGVNTSLAAGASGDVLFSFTMPQGGTFTNCVSVSQAQNPMTPGDPDSTNNTSICTTITVSPPTPTTGSITIIKDAQPNDAQDFTFTSNQASIAPFPLDDDSDSTLADRKTFTGLPAGSYTFTETQVSGWTLASISCTPASGTSTNLSGGSATITLAAGDNVVCTFVNTKPTTGSITIIKDAQPNDAQDFTFTSNQASIAPFPLDDDSDSTLADRKTFTGLPAGSYTFTETQVSGWTLASISCTPASGTSTNLSGGSATITLAAGDNVVCTFVNTKVPTATGSLTIVKNSQPGSAQAFNFTASGAGLSNFTLDDDGNTTNAFSNTVTFNNLAAGIPFTVTEDAVSGWTVPSLQCIVAVPGLTTTFTDQLNRTFTVNLQAGANVTCTFINVYTPPPVGRVCGVKFNDLNGNGLQEAGELGLANWQIGVGIAAIPPVTTGEKGQYCISDLPAGTYTVSEIQKVPWVQTYPAAAGTHTVTLTTGQQLNGVNFGNTLPTGPCYDPSGNPFALLGNGSFETAPLVSPGSYSFFDQTLVPSWNTSASDGQMEIWSNGFQGVPAYSCNHFLELNATMGTTVYQNFTAIPGSTVTITFAHRGRAGYPNQMSVSLGAVGGLPTTLGTYTASTTVWTLHSITYTFPNNGQTAYMIGFVAGDSGPGGNFIDHIQMINTACQDVLVPDLTDLGKPKVFTFLEGTYPHLFPGVGIAGQSAQYSYRFYAQTGNYLAIDDMGAIFMLGSFTDNAVATLGTIDSFRTLISKWYAGPISDSRVFNFAAGNYPDVFKGTPIAGKVEQYSYRVYPQSGNYIAVDNAGMLYLFGPFTNNRPALAMPTRATRDSPAPERGRWQRPRR